jgi:enoyl-CoA hydratase/carnithine racemase
MANVLQVETQGRLLVLRLNRPERKNALNGELFDALRGELRRAASDDDVWAVAITGNGDAFCSGLDLANLGPRDSDPQARDEPAAAPEVDHFTYLMRVACEKPILAGVNGVAVGIGMSLALSADFRIAAPSARFHPGYARIGASPDGGATWTVTEAVGYERAMRFFLESRAISAAEALSIGMIGEVTASDEEFEGRFLEYGQLLAGVAPIAARQTKRLVGRALRPPELIAHLDDEVRLVFHAFATEDSREAVRAMTARDTPHFTGH